MGKEKVSMWLSKARKEKLRRVAKERGQTMTRMMEDWVDRLKEASEEP